MLADLYEPEPMSGCWIWLGGRSNGYGVTPAHVLAHRALYEQEIGPIDPSMEIDHKCRNRSCVNPRHLEAVPHGVNIRRGRRRQYGGPVEGCKRGHPESERYDKNGRGYCRVCQRVASRAWKRRRAEPSR
jgi:hypothetical protein